MTDQRAGSPEPPNPESITACEWRLGDAGLDEIRIVERARPDGPPRYAVVWRGWVASKDDEEWEHEVQPSSRTDEFIARTRSEDWEGAALLAQRMAKKTERLDVSD